MEFAVWIAFFVITLFGWWFLLRQLQKFAVYFEKDAVWGQNFRVDFLRSLLVTFFHATPENHLKFLEKSSLPLRMRLLGLGLRSFSLAFIFLMVFFVWGLMPVRVGAVLALVFFALSPWLKNWRDFSFFFVGLDLFLHGFQQLLQNSAHLIAGGEAAAWIYDLGNNYFEGAWIGLGVGTLLRLLTRTSGVSWWLGMNLLVAGILSLGAAWGFFLGDFLMGAFEDWIRHREKEFRWRCSIALIVGGVLFLLSGPFQALIMNWMNGQYSIQLRALQFGVMVFLGLTLESIMAMGFFHFYYFRQKID